jgi:G:T-mismatch repair DNA endonuclease (very short patch repair protein)
LRSLGWRVLRIWQHELREPTKVARRVGRLLSQDSAMPKGRGERTQRS